jgi:hypothetical protein
MSDIMAKLLESDNLVLIVGGSIAVVAIVSSSVSSVLRAQARERSRREIAAYIAEGSMTPEQGERLLTAGSLKKEGWC